MTKYAWLVATATHEKKPGRKAWVARVFYPDGEIAATVEAHTEQGVKAVARQAAYEVPDSWMRADHMKWTPHNDGSHYLWATTPTNKWIEDRKSRSGK